MKKTVIWENQFKEILFKEQVSIIDLPRVNETVIYMTKKLTVYDITHNFDENHILVSVQEIGVSNQTEQAKAILEANGNFVGNLWHVSDVKSKYKCTDEEAQSILYGALTNDATMEQIWFAIGVHADDEGLEKIEEEENIEAENRYFSINGYWKDSKEEFEDHTVKESEEVLEEEDEEIFFYGLSEEQILSSIASHDAGQENTDDLEFVITSYTEIES